MHDLHQTQASNTRCRSEGQSAELAWTPQKRGRPKGLAEMKADRRGMTTKRGGRSSTPGTSPGQAATPASELGVVAGLYLRKAA